MTTHGPRPPTEGVPRPGLVFHALARLVTTLVWLMRWRLDVRGVENVPVRGGALVTFNHHSYFDFFICALALYRELDRPVRFLAKEEMFRKPGVGWVFRRVKQIPVPRGSREGRKGAFEHAVRALKAGEIIAIAPEQTISRSFELLPFTTGTARMAKEADVPIVPHVNWGTQRFATKGRPIDWRATRIPVLARYGEPMRVGPDEELVDATARLRERMRDMLDELQRTYPDAPEPGEDWWLPARLGGGAPTHDDVLRELSERERRWRGDG